MNSALALGGLYLTDLALANVGLCMADLALALLMHLPRRLGSGLWQPHLRTDHYLRLTFASRIYGNERYVGMALC